MYLIKEKNGTIGFNQFPDMGMTVEYAKKEIEDSNSVPLAIFDEDESHLHVIIPNDYPEETIIEKAGEFGFEVGEASHYTLL